MTLGRRRFLHGLAAGAGSVVAGPLIRVARASEPVVGTVTLLHTNDTHSRIDPFPEGSGRHANRGGVARRTSLIRRVREVWPETLVLDGGDFFQGTPYFNRFKGEIEVKTLQAMGYDAVCIGNHDFDLGVEGLVAAMKHGRFPLLNANYEIQNPALRPLVKPYIVKQLGAVRVGVFGLGVALDGLVNPKQCQGVSYRDPVAAARAAVEELRVDHGAHMVVAVSHLGFNGVLGEPGDQDWPREVKGVDYVVGGHTHTFLDAPRGVRYGRGGWETLVMQVGFAGINVGRADFDISAGTPRLRYAGVVGVGGPAVLA
ncbi:MAG: metallophosphatase [Pseudomonadota bacterium]